MRSGLCALLLATLAGCPPQSGDGYGTYYPPGDVNPGASGCHQDSDCTPDVCARDGECLGLAQVRHIQLTWTITGAAASDTTCTAHPDFEVQFSSDQTGDGIGFAPVPCNEGKFTIDKMPDRFTNASIDDASGNVYVSGPFDGSGNASFDLP